MAMLFIVSMSILAVRYMLMRRKSGSVCARSKGRQLCLRRARD